MKDMQIVTGEERLVDDTSRPALKPEEEQEAEHRTSVQARVVHEAIRRDGETELRRSAAALLWSAVAAGLSMGLSLLGEAVLRRYIPMADWRPLLTKMGYPLGFIVVIIGRQQLLTENTLTPIIPVMHNRNLVTVLRTLRLWGLVLTGNLVGAHIIAWFFAASPALTPEIQQAMLATATEATSLPPWIAFVRAIPAGWLIALVVWLRAATDTGGIAIIALLTYTISICGFTHVVAGSVEGLYLVMSGASPWLSYAAKYLVPVLLGNMIGGITLVGALNHGQVASETK
jgi:formate/nitrite transporter FocA (FNT family)